MASQTADSTPILVAGLCCLLVTVPLGFVVRRLETKAGGGDEMSDGTKDTGVPETQVRDLYKPFGDNEVLRGIDLEIGQGEVVCVIGPSGSASRPSCSV